MQEDHRSYKYYYDDNGNILKHRTGTPEATVDSFAYDWNNRLVYFKNISTGAYASYAYNASGLRVKKYYYDPGRGEGQGEYGTLFSDASNDLGLKSTGTDTVYNKGRDIEKVYIKNEANYFTFTIANRYLFNESNKMKLFITLDLDTLENSGRITLPEDTMTRVPKKAAWECCIFVGDNEFGYYKKDGSKVSKPFGMLAEKTFGDSGSIKIRLAKSLFNNTPVLRYTVSSFNPGVSNSDSLYQGGSSASDVFPGTPATFGGEINGYGEIKTTTNETLITLSTNYTIYYVYDGINPIVEYSPNGSILNRYIYAGGMHIARVSGADTNWYHCDVLGSPRKMTNETPNSVWSATYYPFGEATTSGTNTHQFTGKEMDSEMGLNYFCQRYYDPQIGRFMTLDPQDSPASSPYAYCANNPLRRLDPLGTSWDDFQGALYREFIPWDFSEEQWSWIESNMMRATRNYGHPVFIFQNKDEYGNLLGIDYYESWGVNNPYEESYIIPPAEYFTVLYNPPKTSVPEGEEGYLFSYHQICNLMRTLYLGGLFGGAKGRESILGYAGATVFWQKMDDEKYNALADPISKTIGFRSNRKTTPTEFALTIFHEGFHLGEHWNLYIDEYIVFEEGGWDWIYEDLVHWIGPGSPSWNAEWIMRNIGPDWWH